MDQIKQALISLALDIIAALHIGVVYILPGYLIARLSNDPAYGAIVNILEIVIANQLKKQFPDNQLLNKVF